MQSIVKTDNWEVIEKKCLNVDKDTLVLWDVDGTLITVHEPLFHISNLSYNKQGQLVEQEAKAFCSVDELERYKPIFVHDQWYRAWMTMPFELLDQRIPSTIKSLQQRGIINMAITLLKVQLYTGDDLVKWRVEHLKGFGIDFSKDFLEKPSFLLVSALGKCGVTASEVYRVPIFKEGVLCTHHLPKGPCLEAFFEQTEFWPKKILFVDDQIENLFSIEKVVKQYNMSFEGVHYTLCENFTKEWDEEIARRKWSHFFREGKWPKV